MKFSTGVDSLQNENRFLRVLSKVLLIITAALIGLVLVLYDKSPVLVERTSRGLEVVRPTVFIRAESDMKFAITMMIKARFDSGAVSPELFLNQKQLLLRDHEQREMKARSMNQSVVVRNIKLTKDEVVVDFDRVIAVGEIRSALKAQVKASFEEESPNELNPYGLVLSLVDPIGKTNMADKEERK